MLCPCCGSEMPVTARECSCGARMVGGPLDDTPIKVRRLGPAMASVAVLSAVIASAFVFSYWLALGGLLALVEAWRAIRLSSRKPDLYGGYRAAAAVLCITTAALLVAGVFGLSRIPRVLEKRRMRPEAATQDAFFHWAGLLQEFKSKNGSVPNTVQDFKKELNEVLPMDYWGRPIRYQSINGAIAAANINSRGRTIGINFDNFEIRSAGPDGKMGTADDIVMRDGVIITNPDVVKQPILQDSPDR